jgi:hypothetical protein
LTFGGGLVNPASLAGPHGAERVAGVLHVESAGFDAEPHGEEFHCPYDMMGRLLGPPPLFVGLTGPPPLASLQGAGYVRAGVLRRVRGTTRDPGRVWV